MACVVRGDNKRTIPGKIIFINNLKLKVRFKKQFHEKCRKEPVYIKHFVFINFFNLARSVGIQDLFCLPCIQRRI